MDWWSWVFAESSDRAEVEVAAPWRGAKADTENAADPTAKEIIADLMSILLEKGNGMVSCGSADGCSYRPIDGLLLPRGELRIDGFHIRVSSGQ